MPTAERGDQMPRGPRGERRPADVMGAAVMVAQIAAGEIADNPQSKSGRVCSGHAGARTKAFTSTAQHDCQKGRFGAVEIGYGEK
jgi:hypothetical protein